MIDDNILPYVDPTTPPPTHSSTTSTTTKRPSSVGFMSFGSGGVAMTMTGNDSGGASSSGSSQATKELLKRDRESQVFEAREKRASRLSQATYSQQPKRRRCFFQLDWEIQEEDLTPRQRVARFWSNFWRIVVLLIAFAILGGVICACVWVPALSHAKSKSNAEKESWRHHHTAVSSGIGSRCQVTMINDESVTLACSTMPVGSTESSFGSTTMSATSSASSASFSPSPSHASSSVSSSMPSSTSTAPSATPAPSSSVASTSSFAAATSTQALSSLGA